LEYKSRLVALLCKVLDVDADATFRADDQSSLKCLKKELGVRWSKRIKREGHHLIACVRQEYDRLRKEAEQDSSLKSCEHRAFFAPVLPQPYIQAAWLCLKCLGP
jgi:hypothetical protein